MCWKLVEVWLFFSKTLIGDLVGDRQTKLCIYVAPPNPLPLSHSHPFMIAIPMWLCSWGGGDKRENIQFFNIQFFGFPSLCQAYLLLSHFLANMFWTIFLPFPRFRSKHLYEENIITYTLGYEDWNSKFSIWK